jgi:uncharacterized membrane protein
MNNSRLEAFSDGVIAIIITIMVLELKVPHGTTLEALAPLIPNFLSYVLSFIYVGIYWNNHHHMLHTCESVTGRILWANLHLLFWLSLFPVTTAWMGENHLAAAPSVLYGAVLAGTRLAAQESGRRGLEGQGLTRAVCNRHCHGVLFPASGPMCVRARGSVLAGTGPAHRTRAAAKIAANAAGARG